MRNLRQLGLFGLLAAAAAILAAAHAGVVTQSGPKLYASSSSSSSSSGGASVVYDTPTKYVNNSGSPACSDATTYAANSAGSPWCTLGRAVWGNATRASASSAQAAQAGDVVQVTGGTYNTSQSTGTRYDVVYNPQNDGTEADPIVFQCAEGQTCTLTLSGTTGHTFGSNDRDWITWRNFTINDTANPMWDSDGLVVIVNASNVKIEDCTFIGRDPSPIEGDNYTGVWLDAATAALIRFNLFDDFGDQDENNSGSTSYSSGGAIYEYNTFTNSGSGLYLKANYLDDPPYGYDGFTVRFNLFQANKEAMRVHRQPSPGSDTLIYQNLFVSNVDAGIIIEPHAQVTGLTDPKNIKVVNNTCYNTGICFASGYYLTENGDVEYHNNVSSGGSWVVGYAIWGSDITYSSDRVSGDRNVGYNASQAWGRTTESPTNYTLAQWRTFSSNAMDLNSITSNPNFVSAGSDFHLQAGSPAEDLGRVVFSICGTNGATIDAGAYCSDVSIGDH